MAEEPQVIRGINWRETFSFTHIFRAFRIAIHPSKLVLAFLALFLIYLSGRILDSVWMSKYLAVDGEIEKYETPSTAEALTKWRDDQREEYAQEYAKGLAAVGKDKSELSELSKDPQKALGAARDGKYTRDVRYWIRTQRDKFINEINEQYKKDLAEYDKMKKDSADEKKQAEERKKAIEKNHDDSIREVYSEVTQKMKVIDRIQGRGLFQAFFDYQNRKIHDITDGVLAGNWLGGSGVMMSTAKFFYVAPGWALRHHTVYFFIFGALFLIIWSLFGGAIARIAAVHVADEGRKLSVRQGLSFATSKFLSFLSAPLIPLIIIVGIGAVITVVGAVAFLIPQVGEIVVGVFYFLALAAGFVITLVILGAAGGFNLMYPTIAVEGSDSFDAISRSFSYVYARPWRMLFYSAVAIAYGALCYLFVRLFIWLMLFVTWFFVGLLVFRHANNGADLWATILPRPDFERLPYLLDTQPLSWGSSIASILVSFW